MRIASIAMIVAFTLPSVFWAGCSQNSQGKTRPVPETKTASGPTVGGDLGTLALTNHVETEINITPGQICRIKPQMLNGQDIQLTLTLKTKKANGTMEGLMVTQVIAHRDQSIDIRLGNTAITFTAKMAGE